ncbi:MAG: hypothetical protein MUO19_06835 [Dehalococcoidales bacterium]|nr:hypothetical protein [Dehalococcoidales bacterium]
MNDKSLDILLMIVFGLAGLVLLAAAWVMPGLQLDRVTATIGGAIGIGFAAIRWFMLHREHPDHPEKSVPVEVPVNDRP